MMCNQWFYMMHNQWLRLGVTLPPSWGYFVVIMPNFARFYALFTHFRLNIKRLYVYI